MLVRVLRMLVVVVTILKQKILHINSKLSFAKRKLRKDARVTNGLSNIKIQLGENEDLLEKRFFNETKKLSR